MEIEQLRAFLTLVQTKSFSKTASILHLGQSTISMRISVLEEFIGKSLFSRDNRNVELTAAGRSLLPFAERILNLRLEGIRKVQSSDRYERHLGIGSTDSILQYLLNPVIHQFRRENPKISLSIRSGHSWEVCEHLLDGVIDMGFVYQPLNHADVEAMPFYEDEIILVTKNDDLSHPKALSKKSNLSLENFPLILLNGDQNLEAWLKEHMPTDFVPSVQVDQISTLIQFVILGNYVGFVPRKMVKNFLKEKTLHEISLPKEMCMIPRKGYFIYKASRRVSEEPMLQSWLGLLRKHGYTISMTK